MMRGAAIALLVFLSLSCFGGQPKCQAQKLVQEEVDALKLIGAKLKKQWDFSIEPCSKRMPWVDSYSDSFYTNNLTCNCNSTNSCNVVHIELKGQNLTGELPAEMANLTQLNFIDLTRNYLNGTIPAVWASLPLTNLSLLGNRISGRIPEELGNMTTLKSLVLQDNQMEGPIPASLNKLINLERLFLTGNNFSGELPDLGSLKNMTTFRIDGNPISGKIPSFIGNWTQLQRLDMQGTSLEGPFPPTLANLSSITQLTVSDWRGGDGKFPPLENMKEMRYLYLRNLSISGQLPGYLGTLPNLKTLDLSFNNLSGTIPGSFVGLQSINYMYLTNNMLEGKIPDWILGNKQNLDVSYNNFNGSPAPSTCQEGNVNLFSSYTSVDSNSITSCLRRNQPCSKKPTNYNLFINCGGNKVPIGGREYEDDSSPLGSTRSVVSDSGKWASSSTGSFMDNAQEKYIATNVSALSMPNPALYTTARLSPVSLKYYGLCLQKGNYNVSLHFAETMFTDDETYYGIGRRLFDISIQGKRVLQDFNIAKEANGTGKEVIKTFKADVDVTLEIHLQWVGKGTVSVPRRSVYGPLISAISVTPNFDPDTGDSSKLSVGAIVGIVAAVCVVILLSSAILWICLRRRNAENSELRGLELQTGHFSLRQIKSATNNFDATNKIGEGGFGPVYKGVLPDGTEIAVKQLSSKSKQGNREFLNEIGMISALEHPNLVKLYGCCIDGNQLLLIYEYLENNSLARALFGPEASRLNLDWKTRRMICLGIARGLTYLHEESRLKIVHRDIKATNVLLDRHLNAKISDFGLAKLDEEENTHISTRIAGTIGYMAPEYAMRGYLTDKADVYSFGVVMLEIVSGTSNTNYKPKEEFMYLLDWAYVLEEKGALLELVDSKLGSNYSREEALQMLNLALLCTNPSPTLRPQMSRVVSMLDGRALVQVPSAKGKASYHGDTRFKSFEKLSHDSQTSSMSTDGPWTGSSASHQSRIEKDPLSESRTLSDSTD
ncbi:putative LRR receptor-like serine/threonine-protein kinase isoform X2 [Iris pallida]|uniref:non-specific serine/threonine protein kinase n=1 Tax=Iris pallida TaxID=29817 RepID=A0AAX6ECI9_IRIPA|nr:putative LRR receptor-like serine/threonine-protein kinase isoform X2 [Iris pallida]